MKRLVALLLALVMVVSMLPANVLASDSVAAEASVEDSVEQIVEEPKEEETLDGEGEAAVLSTDGDTVAIDETNFPDANFRSYVLENCDTDGNGSLTEDEIAAVDYIDVTERGIASLVGVEYFTALTDLRCSWNELTALDISKNTALTSLNCGWNELTALDISKNTALTYLECYSNQLTTLDVSENTALTNLECDNNALTTLNVGQNTALASLSCGWNDMAVLDVSQNTALTSLNCNGNALTTLDVSENTALTSLECGENQLSTLDVSQNTMLTNLDCSWNNLTVLDISQNTELTSLSCMRNELTTLDVSQNTELTSLDCKDNNLAALELSANTSLEALYCDSQTITAEAGGSSEACTLDMGAIVGADNIGKVSFTDSETVSYDTDTGIAALTGRPWAVTYIYDDGSDLAEMDVTVTLDYSNIDNSGEAGGDGSGEEPTDPEEPSDPDDPEEPSEPDTADEVLIDETNFPDANFRSYVSENCDTDGNGSLSEDEIADVTSVEVSECGIASLVGVEYFTALTVLDCDGNALTALDVSKNTALTSLDCGGNGLTTLDVSQNAALSDLDCRDNTLTTLDVSNNTALTYLACFNNALTALDVSKNTDLTLLNCGWNELTTLDVSKNIALTDLACHNNALTALDVSRNTALAELNCMWNALTALDVSNNTALTTLHCYKNNLTALDVSQNSALTTLGCGRNELATLDVSQNTALTSLACQENNLTALDVSKNTELAYLDCGWNDLTALNVTQNTELLSLECGWNELSVLDVSENTKLTELWCDGNNIGVLELSANTSLEALYCDSQTITAEAGGSSEACTLDMGAIVGADNISKVSFADTESVTYDTATGIATLTGKPETVIYIYDEGSELDEMDVTVTIDYSKVSDSGEAGGDGSGEEPTDPEEPSDPDEPEEPSEPDTADEILIDETTFPDANFRSYVSENCDTDGNGSLSEDEVSAVTSLIVEYKDIASLVGIEYFTALTYLDCHGNALTSLDVSNNIDLMVLWCDGNALTSLDVRNNTSLTELYCDYNELTDLDLSQNTALGRLFCGNNALTTLDVSKNTALEDLDCSDNDLTALDVSKNTALAYLDCGWNNLAAIDVSNNTALTYLGCDNNDLTALDISNNTDLTELDCFYTGLTALDISKNTALTKLWCHFNYLTTLDVSNNTALTHLCCSGNDLTKLDVSKNTALTSLDCSENDLTTLDVSKNTALTYLDCHDNALTALDVSKNTALTELRCNGNNIGVLDLSSNTALENLECYGQEITTVASGSKKACTLDMKAIVGAENISKVSFVFVDEETVTYDIDTGIAALNGKPETVTYVYDSGSDLAEMDVTVTIDYSKLTEEIPVDPPVIAASNVASTGKIRLTWDAVDGAAEYVIYRAASKSGTYYKHYTVTGTSYTNKLVAPGECYYYKVCAVSEAGTKSEFSNIVYRTCDYAQPVVTADNVASTGKIKLNWDAVDGATKYVVYRATSSNGSYYRKTTTSYTSYTDTSAVKGKTYYYKVRAIGSVSGAASAYSTVRSRTCDYERPVVTADNVASTGKIKLTWDAVDGATKYEVYRSTSSNGTYDRKTTTANEYYTDTTAVKGKTYYYKVRAIGSVSGAASAYSTVRSRTCDYAQPVVTTSNVASSGKIKLTWDAVDGATKYEVYRSTSSDGTYDKKTTTANEYYTDTTAVKGKTYYYKVRAIGSVSGATSAFSTVKSRTCDYTRPAVTVSNASSGKPRLTWKAVSGATKYEVYRATSKNGTYYKQYTTSSTSYTNTSAVKGKTYYYKVRAIGSVSAATSAYSTIASRTCK